MRHDMRDGLRAYGLAALALLAVAGCSKHTPRAASGGMSPLLLPAEPAQPGPTYRINTGDELHVRFTYHADQNEQVPVRPDGRITLATTGEVAVAGMTPGELEELIADRSRNRQRDPEVHVIVTKIGEQRVYVGGEVARPGYVQLQPGMTPVQAVMQTGGFRMTAKPESTLLLSPRRDGEVSAARLNLKQVVEEGVPERVRLAAGDVIFVPSSWIGDANKVVDLYVRGLIPVLPRVGVGYSLSDTGN
jgi:protein involved in polysaccharide export with SLBB domain